MIYDETTERLDYINESLTIIQKKDGLTFGTDSYLLAAFSRSISRGKCVEFGGGTGVVSLLMAARQKYAAIYSVEVQEYFASLIGRNAEFNNLSDTVKNVYADVRSISSAMFSGEVDSVVSNPPYMKADSGRGNLSPEMNAARREENGTITDFCASASRILKWGGYFTVVYRPDRLADLLCAMRNANLEPKRMIMAYPSASDKPCLTLVEAKKGAASGLIVSRPLLIYSDKASGNYTPDMQAVYDSFSLEHLF